MNIRAGIIYLLIYDKYTKSHIMEIIYWSGLSKKIKSLIDAYKILELAINDEIDYKAPVDFTLETCFGSETPIVDRFLGGIDLDIVAYYYYEYSFYTRIRNPARNWNKNTIGHKNEDNTIYLLNVVYGYDIQRIARGSYTVPDSDIVISGTPDGIINASPGGVFNGYLVEIKYGNTADQIEKNCIQIAAYSKIFDAPVLLINYYRGRYCIYKYSKRKLEKIWDSIIDRLTTSIKNIKMHICIESPYSVAQYLDFIENRKSIND